MDTDFQGNRRNNKMNCGLCNEAIYQEPFRLAKVDDVEEFCHVECIEKHDLEAKASQ